jgi:DNA-binding MarR family transcriptional regulator
VKPSTTAKRVPHLEESRRRNLRQLLLRASRAVNREVVAELRARGYASLRATHTTLLSNIDLTGSSVTDAADRAGITKQAMGRLAAELQAAGFVRLKRDPRDARVRVLVLTRGGERLMLESLQVMAELQRRYAHAIGKFRFAAALAALEGLVAHLESPQPMAQRR